MPGFDKTGPQGFGQLTGRGMGPCGLGMGYGRGFGRRFYSRKEEVELLKEEINELEKEKDAIRERLSELEGQK